MTTKTEKRKIKHPEFLFTIYSIVGALIIGGIFIIFAGGNPITTYGAMLKGALGSSYALSDTFNNALPLILTGLSVAFASKVGVFNIGAEGQLYMGALFATLVGLFVELPPFLHSLAAIIAALIGGALWAFIAAILKEKRSVNVVISTILLNYLGVSLIHYLVNGPIKTEGLLVATDMVAESARLSYIIKMPYGITTGIIYVLIVVFATYILLNKTSFGYKIKAVGSNKDAANYAGMNAGVLSLTGLVISGSFAGLAGGIEIISRQFRLISGFSPGYGYTGIPIALLARNNPIGVIFAAVFFSILSTGTVEMQRQGISTSVISIIQGLIVLFIAGEFAFRHIIKKKTNQSSKREEA